MSERYRPITSFIREISVEPKISPQQAFTPEPSQETIVIERFEDEEEDCDPGTVGPVIFSPERNPFSHTYLNSDPLIKKQQLVEFGILPPNPETTPQQRIEAMGYELVEESKVTVDFFAPTSQGSHHRTRYGVFGVNGTTLICSKDPQGINRLIAKMVEDDQPNMMTALKQMTRHTPKSEPNTTIEIYRKPVPDEQLIHIPLLTIAAEINSRGVFRTINLDPTSGHSDVQTIDRIIEDVRTLTNQSRQ